MNIEKFSKELAEIKKPLLDNYCEETNSIEMDLEGMKELYRRSEKICLEIDYLCLVEGEDEENYMIQERALNLNKILSAMVHSAEQLEIA